LAGQFADLEEPADAITIDAAQSPEQIVAKSASNWGYLEMRDLPKQKTSALCRRWLRRRSRRVGRSETNLGDLRAPSSV